MVLFIIGFVLLLVGIILICIVIDKGRALRKINDGIIFSTDIPEEKKAVANLNENFHREIKDRIEKNNSSGLLQLGLLLFWFGLMFFIDSVFVSLREYYIKQYCDGKYEWAYSAYVNENGEVRTSGSKKLVMTKNIKGGKTYYLQKENSPTE